MNGILTLEEDRYSGMPEGFMVSSFKYGETKSLLGPGFDKDCPQIEGKYKIDVPEEVLNICKEIKTLGGRAFLVGGSVRDSVISSEIEGMSLRPKDFDLEVYGIEPKDLMTILGTNFDLKASGTVGKAFEIIKVKIDGWDEPLDFSIPRIDSKMGVGHKGFEITACPSMTIAEAAKRRDIRVNTCAYDPLTGILYDPYGGVEGIKNQLIEVTDENTFQEDPLRILRVMQFSARFGFEVSDTTKELCKKMVERGDLDELAMNRISEEMKKLVTKGKIPSLGIKFALEVGIVEKYWPELFVTVGIPQEFSEQYPWHPEGDVWTHGLQVMDAAALIADRENLEKEQRETLVWSALGHDLGKATTTEFVDGAIRSRGHEQAGVEPTLNFLGRFSNPHEPNTGIVMEVRKAASALVGEHLKPKMYWMEAIKGSNMDGAVRRLSRKLGKAGTSIYMLSLLAEADQRGRNGESTVPLKREDVDELVEWQLWLGEKALALDVIEKAPEKICTGSAILKLINGKGGPWVGAIAECVYADQLDGLVESVEQVDERVLYYYGILEGRVRLVSGETGRSERAIWDEIRRAEDPREYASGN